MARAVCTGDVSLAAKQVLPDGLGRTQQLVVVSFDRNVDDTRLQIELTHCVARSRRALANGRMVQEI